RFEVRLGIVAVHPAKLLLEFGKVWLDVGDDGGEGRDGLVHQQIRDLGHEIRLLEETPEVFDRATLLQDGVNEHLEKLEREAPVAEHFLQILLFLAGHGITSLVFGLPLILTPCQDIRLTNLAGFPSLLKSLLHPSESQEMYFI
ncbi:MAG: hypothetical protein UV20_C0002G0001, partial [Candidatus Magasanikbacteria bacterium GW2011_GWA2_42_32]